jgi:imidazolonepropionase
LVDHIGQLVAPAPLDLKARRPQASLFRVAEDQALAVVGGRVAAWGPRTEMGARFPTLPRWDAGGRLVTPGLVDAHTHLLYAGHRAHEVALKARGATYLEILAAGGGILATVRATRQATPAALLDATRERLRRAVLHGSTTVEVKTGYALSVDGELRQLDLLAQLRAEGPWRLVLTFLGAHAVPEEYRGRPGDYLAALKAAHPRLVGRADFVDIFLEPGVFEPKDAVPYLEDARRHNLPLKLHVDELNDAGGAAWGARLGAVSVDHLAHTGPAGIAALAESSTVAVLLPGTSAYLNQGSFAPARALLDSGVPVAVASDGNPGSSPTVAVGPLLPWAAAWLRMTAEELWPAVTTVAGAAVGRAEAGSLDPGAPADFLVWETDDYRVPCHDYGVNLVAETWIGGRRVAAGGQWLWPETN